MAATSAAAAAPSPLHQRPVRQRDVNVLGIAVLVVYGITYYAIGTAAPAMAATFGAGTEAVFGAFSVGLFVNAALAPAAGRLIDRIGAVRALVVGLLGRAAAVAAMTFAQDIWSLAALIVAVMLFAQITEYDVTFAAVVERAGTQARQGITQITLWSGIASTVFWPLTVWLLELTSWRMMFLGYAGLLLAMALLVAGVVGLGRPARPSTSDATMPPAAAADGSRTESQTGPGDATAFWLLTVAFALASVAMALPVILIPVLAGLGYGAATAALAGAVFGPAQTAARLMEFVVANRMRPTLVAVLATALLPMSLLVVLAGPSLPVALVFAVLFGAGAGVSYVVRGTVALVLFGPNQYATLLGRMASYRLAVAACMPFVFAVVMERFGASAVIGLAVAASAVATGLFAVLHRRSVR